MRYLVTGGTGFIGGEVVRQLRAAGDEVVALVREPARASKLADLGAQLALGDITEPESVRAAMAGVDGVFHIAGWYRVGVKDSSDAWAINVDGTRNVLAAMKNLGISRGVYTSTLAVFSDTHGQIVDERYRHNGPWLSVYDHTKWAAHYEVAEPMIQAGLPLIVVQPGAVYGVGDQSALGDALRGYLQRRLPAIPGGRRTAGATSRTRRARTSWPCSAARQARATSSPGLRTRWRKRCASRRTSRAFRRRASSHHRR